MLITKKRHLNISIIIVFSIIIILSGCKTIDQLVIDDYTYLVQRITLPRDIGEINNLAYYDDKVFFAASEIIPPYTLEDYEQFVSASIYSMNIDGTELTRLVNYKPSNLLSDDTCGFVQIHDIDVDDDGYIWVVELWDYFIFRLPVQFNAEVDDIWDYKETTNSGYAIRKLATDGEELKKIDITAIDDLKQYSIINDIAVISGADNDEIYISTTDNNLGKTSIHVFDTDSNTIFKTEIQSKKIDLIKTQDREIVVFTIEGELFSINIKTGVLNNLNQSSENIQTIKTLDFKSFGVERNHIKDIALLPNGSIQFLNTQKLSSGRQRAELIILIKTLQSEIPEKIVLTLAGYSVDSAVVRAVHDFNVNNPYYSIEIIDYNDANISLAFDITTGNIPDIIAFAGEYDSYVSAGLLADLYPFIDSDIELSRDDFIQGYLSAVEIDGKLYKVSSAITILTIIGNSSVLGSDMGWNLDDIIAVLDAHPDADIPIGGYYHFDYSLEQYLYAIAVPTFINDFINWETYTADFTNPQFIKYLDLIHRFFKNAPQMNYDDYESGFNAFLKALNSGRQIMVLQELCDIGQLRNYKTLFGDNYVFKGLPNMASGGHYINNLPINIATLAITQNSQHKDAAWGFVRTILDADWQNDNVLCIPTNTIAFNDAVNRALQDDTKSFMYDLLIDKKLEYSDIYKLNNLLNCVSELHVYDNVLVDLIMEGVIDYYNGLINAENVVKNTQERVTLYLSEQN